MSSGNLTQLPPVQNAVTSQTSYAVICFLPSFLDAGPRGLPAEPSARPAEPGRAQPSARPRTGRSQGSRSPGTAESGPVRTRFSGQESLPNPSDTKPTAWPLRRLNLAAFPPAACCLLSLSKVLSSPKDGHAFCSAFSSRENLSRNNLVLLFLCHKGSQHYHPHSISTRNYLSALSMQCLPQH